MRSFTLLEFIIYAAIVGVMMATMAGFLWNVVFGNIKETSYQEVQQNARFVLAKITQETKKAVSIASPAEPGESLQSMSLLMADGSLTVFDVFDNKLRITQRNNSYYLTSDQVEVSNLIFTNLSYEGTQGTVRVEITIEHINPGNKIEYQASVSLHSSITLLPGGGVFSEFYLAQTHYRWRKDDGAE